MSPIHGKITAYRVNKYALKVTHPLALLGLPHVHSHTYVCTYVYVAYSDQREFVKILVFQGLKTHFVLAIGKSFLKEIAFPKVICFFWPRLTVHVKLAAFLRNCGGNGN